MKKVLLFILLLPLGLSAQSIVGETGTNGQFVVGKSSTGVAGGPMDTTFSIDPGSNEIILGQRESPIKATTLPLGNVHFLHEGGSERVNIIAAPGSGFSAFPKLQFFYTAGSLANPSAVADGNTLGTISFGGWNTAWIGNMASIDGRVDGTPGTSTPTRIELTTSDASSNNNIMTFDSDGNLNVPGTVISKAIEESTTNAITLTASDYVVVLTSATAQTVTLPSSPVTGQVYIIKKGTIANVAHTIDGNGFLIDGSTSITLPLGGAGISQDFVQLIYTGTGWFIIGQ